MIKNVYQSQYTRFFQLSQYLIPAHALRPDNIDYERWNRWDKQENRHASKL